MCKSISVNQLQRFTVLGDELRREIYRGDNGDLLAEYCPYGDFKSVPGARNSQTRTLGDEGCEQRVSAEIIPDGQRVRAQVENAPDTANDPCQCADVGKADRHKQGRPPIVGFDADPPCAPSSAMERR